MSLMATTPENKGKLTMLAIVETGGKQYQMTEGRYVDIELLNAQPEDKVVLDKIVMIVDGENSTIGAPYIANASISGRVMLNGKEAKVLVYKQRCKKGYRKKQGHRQQYTRLFVESITVDGKVCSAPAVETTTEAPAKKVAAKKAPAAKKATEPKAEKAPAKKTTKKAVKEEAATEE